MAAAPVQKIKLQSASREELCEMVRRQSQRIKEYQQTTKEQEDRIAAAAADAARLQHELDESATQLSFCQSQLAAAQQKLDTTEDTIAQLLGQLDASERTQPGPVVGPPAASANTNTVEEIADLQAAAVALRRQREAGDTFKSQVDSEAAHVAAMTEEKRRSVTDVDAIKAEMRHLQQLYWAVDLERRELQNAVSASNKYAGTLEAQLRQNLRWTKTLVPKLPAAVEESSVGSDPSPRNDDRSQHSASSDPAFSRGFGSTHDMLSLPKPSKAASLGSGIASFFGVPHSKSGDMAFLRQRVATLERQLEERDALDEDRKRSNDAVESHRADFISGMAAEIERLTAEVNKLRASPHAAAEVTVRTDNRAVTAPVAAPVSVAAASVQTMSSNDADDEEASLLLRRLETALAAL